MSRDVTLFVFAGRRWRPGQPIGDEAAVNLQRRAIWTGMSAVHVSFGPQHTTTEQETRWRDEYRHIIDTYLGAR